MYLDVPVLAVLMNMLMLHHQWLAGYLNPADRTVDTVQVARCIQTVDHVVAFMTVLYLNGLLKRKKRAIDGDAVIAGVDNKKRMGN